jgi:cysteine desulfurase
MSDRVYLDYSAGMPTDDRVVKAMMPYFTESYGNPSSLHAHGGPTRRAVEKAREQVAKLINSPETRFVIFTSGATESNNLAIKGLARKRAGKGKHIVTTVIEHPSILNVCSALEKEGFEVTYLKVDREGTVSVDDIAKAMRDDTFLVTLCYANNEVGTIQDIKAIGTLCREKKVAFHVDGVPAAGRVPIDVQAENIDLLSLSSNDLYGPKGVGALYVGKGISLAPLVDGGGHERKMRSGTENVPGIVGMGKAAEIALDEMVEESERLRRLRDRLIDGVLEAIPASHLNGHRTRRVPQNANLRFSYVEGEALILNLDMVSISTSTSSACTSKTLEPSHVLMAMGIPHEEAHSALLFNMGRWTSEEDIDRVIKELPDIVKRLREMSPITPKGLYK